jgi:O-antigen ligase
MATVMAMGTATSTASPGTGIFSPRAGGEAAAAGTSRRPLRVPITAPAAAVAVAVAAPVLLHGGFTAEARSLFVGLALVALAIVLGRDDEEGAGLMHEPAVLCLLALAAITATSAAWSVGDGAAAVRAGLVISGLAALALSAAWMTRRGGLAVAVGIIIAMAMVEAILGLVSVALHHEPWAILLGGGWRPAGTFEYPPALALLEVSALPALLSGITYGGRMVRVGAAIGLLLAGATIVLSDSRLALGLAAATVLVFWCVAPTTPDRRRRQGRLPALAAVAGLIAAVGVLMAVSASSNGPAEPTNGIDHGRIDEWGVATDVALAHPLTGAGADSYAQAAADERSGGSATLYAHSLPLEAWAEVGPLGLAAVLGLYASVLALVWRLRHDRRAWLVAPAALAFLAANLVDWPWHLAGAAAVWALALGACLGLAKPRLPSPRRPPAQA